MPLRECRLDTTSVVSCWLLLNVFSHSSALIEQFFTEAHT